MAQYGTVPRNAVVNYILSLPVSSLHISLTWKISLAELPLLKFLITILILN